MNANELADKAESMKKYGYTDGWIGEVATMLRQQQAEIEELRKFKAEIDAENKKLFESVQKANAMWDRATGVKNEQ